MQQLSAQDTIITANKRQVLALSAYYLRNYPRKITPRIVNYQQFLLTSKPIDATLVVSDYQQFIIFSNLIYNKFAIGEFSINLIHKQLAQTCQGEYALVRQFNIPLSEFDQYFNDKGQVLLDVINAYRAYLDKHQYCDEFDLAEQLIVGKTTIDNTYYYGFNILTTQQQILFKKHNIKPYKLVRKTINVHQALAFATVDEELDAISAYLVAQSTQNPQQKIAVVVPELSKLRPQIIWRLDKAFGYHNQFKAQVDKCYNLSLGRSLSDYPLVKSAMNVLQFSYDFYRDVLSKDLCAEILLSPFIITTGSDEYYYRHHFVVNTLPKLSNEFKVRDFLTMLPKECPRLYQAISALEAKFNNFDKYQSYSQWMTLFIDILVSFSWISDLHLSSVEYQCFNKYQQAQLNFNSLDQLTINVSMIVALNHWFDLLQQTIFQPKLKNQPNIHIIGALEAQGLFFDQIWLMGADSNFLPGIIKNYRFIDSQIAAKFFLPNSSYSRLSNEASGVYQYLSKIADKFFCSYAKLNDKQQRLPTPFIKFSDVINQPVAIKEPKALITVTDNYASSLDNLDITQGVKTLQYQSQCSFRGFGQRLKITTIEDQVLGLSSMQKGVFIHRVLQSIYRAIPNQEELLKVGDLTMLVKSHLNSCLPDNSIFWQLEFSRTLPVIVDFLQREQQRQPFKILATEKRQKVNIDGLTFEVFIDRLDQDQNGNLLMFDYKTKKDLTLKDIGWKNGTAVNIKESQLPIYALNNPIDALVFVQLTSAKTNYIGCSKNNIMTEQLGKNSNSEQFAILKNHWQISLDETSRDFQNGKAAVIPQKGACDYCNLDSLCRKLHDL